MCRLARWKQTGNWWELPGDLNADGIVNVGDLAILGANYRRELTPPGGAEAAADMAGDGEAATLAGGAETVRPAGGDSDAPRQAAQAAPAAAVVATEILTPLTQAGGTSLRTTIFDRPAGSPDGGEAVDLLRLARLGMPLAG